MRCLAIDYGHKRIGLAYGDELGLAFPLEAAVEPDFSARMAHLAREIGRRKIDTLVVGYPYHMDGSRSQKTDEVDAFIKELEAAFGLPVVKTDERLTSQEAESLQKKKARSVRERQKQRKSGQTDSRAAALFLQDYLDQNAPPASPLAEDSPFN